MNQSVANKSLVELSSDATAARMNYEILEFKIQDSNLQPLLNGDLEPTTVPKYPGSLEDFKKANNIGKKPKMLDKVLFSAKWAILHIEECSGFDYENPSTEEIGVCHTALQNLTRKKKIKFISEMEDKQAKAIEKIDAYNDRLRGVRALYDRKLSDFNKATEAFKQENIKYEQTVEKFTELISIYFSDNVIKELRADISERKYKDALKKLKELVFKGTDDEGNYLRGILDNTVYKSTMNFPVFLKSLKLVHTMLNECHMPRTNAEKVRDMENMIIKGDCFHFKDAIKSLKKLTDYDYDFLKDRLRKLYERMLLDGTLSLKRDREGNGNNHSASYTSSSYKKQRIQCPECKKYHPGKCRAKEFQNKRNKKTSYSKLQDELKDLTSKYNALQTVKEKENPRDDGDDPFLKFTRHQANMISDDDYHAGQLCSDSGASITMISDPQRVQNLRTARENIKLANGDSIKSIGRGSMNGIDNVLVVPDLKDSLISASQWDLKGCYTVYGGKQVIIYDSPPQSSNVSIIAKGKLHKNGLYYFDDDETFNGELHANDDSPSGHASL
jgi:hypothetical protein